MSTLDEILGQAGFDNPDGAAPTKQAIKDLMLEKIDYWAEHDGVDLTHLRDEVEKL